HNIAGVVDGGGDAQTPSAGGTDHVVQVLESERIAVHEPLELRRGRVPGAPADEVAAGVHALSERWSFPPGRDLIDHSGRKAKSERSHDAIQLAAADDEVACHVVN